MYKVLLHIFTHVSTFYLLRTISYVLVTTYYLLLPSHGFLRTTVYILLTTSYYFLLTYLPLKGATRNKKMKANAKANRKKQIPPPRERQDLALKRISS